MSMTQPGFKSSHKKLIIFPVKHDGNGKSALYNKTIFTTFLIQICIWKCEFIWTSCQVAKDWQWDCFLESTFSFERYFHVRASRESKNTSSFQIQRGPIVSHTTQGCRHCLQAANFLSILSGCLSTCHPFVSTLLKYIYIYIYMYTVDLQWCKQSVYSGCNLQWLASAVRQSEPVLRIYTSTHF